MNPKKVFDLVKKNFENLTFSIEDYESNFIEFNAEFTAEDYFDDSVYARFTVYENGNSRAIFTFDSLEPTPTALQKINDFNENSVWFKAYITKRGETNFLELQFINLGFDGNTEEDAANAIGFALNELLDDYTLEDLKPLTELSN